MKFNMKLVSDILVLFAWIVFMIISVLVILTTNQLYFKTFATFVAILLSVLGTFWLIVVIIAVIFSITVRLGLAQTVSCGTHITKQFEKKFLSSDFDRWEVEKLIINRRIQREVLSVYFLVNVFNAKQDTSRVSRFLYFWKEVRIRVDLIVKAMNEVEWNQKRLTDQNYLNVVEALRQLDSILRTYDYWNEKFEFLKEDIVRRRHRQEFQTLLNDAVIPEDRKESFVFKAISKSLTNFEENLKEKLKKHE